MKYKVLNLYAGIGGNRKHWDNCQVTAVELNPEIAAIYQDFFPDDTVIIGDAHQYLLDHFKEFDFIWSSPPCQSHTRLNTASFAKGSKDYVYPDMTLYQQIIFLKHWFYGKWVIENVIPYYKPLINGIKLGRHLFWSNLKLNNIKDYNIANHDTRTEKYLSKVLNIDLSNYSINNKKQCLRNCVNPDLGKYIFDRARNIQIEENIPQGKLEFQ